MKVYNRLFKSTENKVNKMSLKEKRVRLIQLVVKEDRNLLSDPIEIYEHMLIIDHLEGLLK